MIDKDKIHLNELDQEKQPPEKQDKALTKYIYISIAALISPIIEIIILLFLL